MTGRPELAVFDAVGAEPLLDQLVAVYVEIYAEPDDAFHGAARYRRQITGHMRAPGWKLVTATVASELAGYAYGFHLPSTSRWWEGLRPPVPAGFTDEDGRRTFAVSEIMVRAPWRRRGIARALHDELLAGVPRERATLLAEPGNSPAQVAYARWGWRKLAELRPDWDDAPLYDVLILDRFHPGWPPARPK